MRAAYKRYVNVISPQDPTSLSALGSPISISGVPTLPYIAASGRIALGNLSQGYQYKVNGSIQLDDTLSWQHGYHKFSTGVEWLRLEYLNRTQSPGEVAYSSTVAAANNINASLITGTTGSNTVAGPVGRRLQLSGTLHF